MIVIRGGQNVNQFSQQPGNFQTQQGFQNQAPVGFVQSNYQGQLSFPTFGRQSSSIVSNAQGGYQGQGMQQQFGAANYSSQPSAYISHQPVQSYAQSPATAFGSFGPVISHVGFQAGPDNQQGRQQNFNQPLANFGAQNAQFSNYGGFAQSNAQSGYGPTPVQSFTTSQNPVLEATNAYQQAGPVISHLGGWQANNAQNSPYSGGMR
jgi:hypothetical protein